MKLLSFTILILFSCSSLAVEFYRCTDDKGQEHYTNLPKSSLDTNCVQKDRHIMMLDQDYSNLQNELKQYEIKVDDTEIEEYENINSLDDYDDESLLNPLKMFLTQI